MNYLDIDLESVDISKAGGMSMLPDGSHECLIEAAKVTQTKNGHPQLEVKYKNDQGVMTQWIIFNHPNADATRIGREQLKLLLNNLGYEGAKPPSVEWYVDKPIGITVRSKLEQGKNTTRVVKTFTVAATKTPLPLDDEIPF